VADWKRWKRGYWSCLNLLGVINIAKGHYDGAAFFFGIVAVWAHGCRMVAPAQTVACFRHSINALL